MRSKAERKAASRAAEALLDPEATFKPAVSAASQAILQSSQHAADPWRQRGSASLAGLSSASDKAGGGLNIWDVQFMEANQRRSERMMLQQLYELDAQRDCPHQPLISDASKRIDETARDRSGTAAARASAAAARRQQRSGSAPHERRQHLPPRVEAARQGTCPAQRPTYG